MHKKINSDDAAECSGERERSYSLNYRSDQQQCRSTLIPSVLSNTKKYHIGNISQFSDSNKTNKLQKIINLQISPSK